MLYNCETLSLRVLAAYRYVHPDGYFHVKPRPFASLSFRVGGTADFKIGDKTLEARPGNVVFIPRGISFEVEYSVSEYLVIELEDCDYGEAEVIPLKNPAEISLLFLELLSSWRERHSVNGAKAAVYTILERVEADQKASLENTAFASCLRYIEENYCDPALDVATVCSRGFISISSLQRAFSQHFGMSPMQYVIKLRMSKAARLLAENRHRVKEIAYLCGFLDEKYFSRAFKKAYGYPPSKLCSSMLR